MVSALVVVACDIGPLSPGEQVWADNDRSFVGAE